MNKWLPVLQVVTMIVLGICIVLFGNLISGMIVIGYSLVFLNDAIYALKHNNPRRVWWINE